MDFILYNTIPGNIYVDVTQAMPESLKKVPDQGIPHVRMWDPPPPKIGDEKILVIIPCTITTQHC